jgi:adenylate kinase
LARFVIAVSGTPGTGKSVFARALAKRLKAKLIDLNRFAVESGVCTTDQDGTKVVDVRKLRGEFARQFKNYRGSVVVEGLLSHLLQKNLLTHVVVLRTNPKVLEKRLIARGYPRAKTAENVEAEALDVILWEAVHGHGIDRVYELDTTNLKARDAVKMFTLALSNEISLRPGKVDWLEDYLKFKGPEGNSGKMLKYIGKE